MKSNVRNLQVSSYYHGIPSTGYVSFEDGFTCIFDFNLDEDACPRLLSLYGLVALRRSDARVQTTYDAIVSHVRDALRRLENA